MWACLEIFRILWAQRDHCHANYLSLSWARLVQSSPSHPVSLRHISVTLLSSKCSFTLRFSYKRLEHICFLPLCSTCLAHLILLDLITWITFVRNIHTYITISLSHCFFICYITNLHIYIYIYQISRHIINKKRYSSVPLYWIPSKMKILVLLGKRSP